MIDAYDRLLSDAMARRPAAVRTSGRSRVRVADRRSGAPPPSPPEDYEPNTWGPAAADGLPHRRRVAGAGRAELLMRVTGFATPSRSRSAADATVASRTRSDRGARRLHAGARGRRHTSASVREARRRSRDRLVARRVLLGRRAAGASGAPGVELRHGASGAARPLGIDPRRIHRIEAERGDLDAVARDYEQELAKIAGGTLDGPPHASTSCCSGWAPTATRLRCSPTPLRCRSRGAGWSRTTCRSSRPAGSRSRFR